MLGQKGGSNLGVSCDRLLIHLIRGVKLSLGAQQPVLQAKAANVGKTRNGMLSKPQVFISCKCSTDNRITYSQSISGTLKIS